MADDAGGDLSGRWAALTEGLPGAEFRFKPEWECYVLTVAGKIFGLVSDHRDYGAILTVKGDPDDNEALRQQYESVIPGYHVNKRHWNTVKLDMGEVPDQVLDELVEDSYALVRASLPKAVRSTLGE